jgi:hypothetical protein
MASPDGPPPPVSNPITWRNSFADKDQKGRDLQKILPRGRTHLRPVENVPCILFCISRGIV